VGLSGEERARIRTLQSQAEEVFRPETGDDEGPLSPHPRHLPRGIFVMVLEPTPWGWSADDSMTLKLARLETILWYP
jgi:hypothetical protein